MKCKSCGTEIPENTRFCPNCGLLVSAQISFDGIRKALKPVEYRMPEKKKREDAPPAFAPGGKEEEAEKTVSSASAEERAEEDQKFSEEMDQLHFDFSLDRSRLGPVREGEEREWEPPELFTRLSEDEEPEESTFSYEEPRAEDSLESVENTRDTVFSNERKASEGSEENASDTERYAASPDNEGEALSSRGETEREEAEAEMEQAEAEAERERIRRAEAERSEEEARLQRMEAEREKIRRAEAERRAEEAERHRLAEEARREEEERIRRAEAERKALEEERARASENAKTEEQERITAELKAFLGTEEESDSEPETKNSEEISASSSEEKEAERESFASPEAEPRSLMETDSHPLAEETSASREEEEPEERAIGEEQSPDAEIRESSWWEEEEKRENGSADTSSSLPPLSEEEKARMASEMLGEGRKSEDVPSLSEEREDPTPKEHSSKSVERDPFIWGESRADRSEKEKRSERGKKKERERRSGGRKAGSGKEGKKKGGALKLFLPAAATAAAIAAALWYMNLPAVKRSGELNMGREAVKKQHYEQAIPILEKLLSEKEGGKEAYLLLVDAYEKAGKHEEAVKTLSAAVESFPEDSELKQQLELLNPKLSFSVAGGSYQDPQEIRISGPEGAEIRYSLSGGGLEEGKDTVYENPIHLDTNGSYHLSAFAKASDGAEGDTLSADYEIALDSAKYHLNDWSDTDAGRIFLDENGRRRTGWFQKDGNWYYFNADGILQTGLQEIDGDQYFLKEDGVCLISAWQEIDGELYYFGPDGRMQKNQWVDGNYYVGEDGRRQKNTTIDGKHLNEEGQAAFHAAEEYKAHPDMIVVAHSKQRVDKGNYYIIPSTVYYEKKNGRPVGKPAYQIDVKILKEAYVHYLDEDYMTIIAQDSVSFLPELYMQKIIQNEKGYIKDYSFVLGEDKG